MREAQALRLQAFISQLSNHGLFPFNPSKDCSVDEAITRLKKFEPALGELHNPCVAVNCCRSQKAGTKTNVRLCTLFREEAEDIEKSMPGRLCLECYLEGTHITKRCEHPTSTQNK